MQIDTTPDFMSLARTSIEIFHPEVLNFPDHIIEMAVAFKAEKLRESYEQMLAERKR
jgi:hypothetical protein